MSTLKQIEGLARSLKLKLAFTPEHDPAHDLIDRIIELCAGQPSDRAMDFLRSKVDDVESARVSQYEKAGQLLAVGIPKHQPFLQQVEWCERKGADTIEVYMVIRRDDYFGNRIETFNINEFKK